MPATYDDHTEGGGNNFADDTVAVNLGKVNTVSKKSKKAGDVKYAYPFTCPLSIHLLRAV